MPRLFTPYIFQANLAPDGVESGGSGEQTPEPSTPEITPDQSEDDVMSAVYDSAMSDDTSEETPSLVPEALSNGEPERDEQGRFAAKETASQEETTEPEAETVEETATEESTEPEAEVDAQTEPAKDAPSEGHFRGWTKEKREAFGNLPDEAQKFVLDHQGELQGHFSRKETEFAQYADTVKPFMEVIQGNSDYFDKVSASLDASPQDIISSLVQTEQALRFGTFEEKAAVLQNMAEGYGIPLQMAEADPFADPNQPGSEQYAQFHDMQQEIVDLRSQVTQNERQSTVNRDQTATNQIDQFRSAAGPDGQPLHPHFDTVRAHMGGLLDAGQATSIDQAYEMAAQPLEASIKAQADARASAGKKAAEQATRAGRINVQTAPTAINRFETEDEALSHAFDVAMSN